MSATTNLEPSLQKSIKVLVLLTQQIIHVVKYTVIDATRDLIKQMDDMANSEPASGEDLLADDGAILSGAERTFDITEPAMTDIIEHQVVEDHDLDEGLHPAERQVTYASYFRVLRSSAP